MSKSGIRYGAFTEIRENTLNPNSAVGTTGGGSVVRHRQRVSPLPAPRRRAPRASTTQQTLYVRQAWAYVGTDTVGLVRIGQGFSANSLMETGLNDEFDAGGWDRLQTGGLLTRRRPARSGRGRTSATSTRRHVSPICRRCSPGSTR